MTAKRRRNIGTALRALSHLCDDVPYHTQLPAGRRKRRGLAFGALLGMVALSAPALCNPQRPVFAADSFWYQPIPANVPLNTNSDAYVAEFLRQYQTYYNSVGVNLSAYSAPLYTVGRYAKTVPVQQWSCQNYLDPGLAYQWAQVPIPSYAIPAYGTDAEMAIYQPYTDTLWEFWQANKNGRQWQACWGGRMDNVSQNPGIWPSPYGIAATGLPIAPGQVTVAELQKGVIRHVIGIALVDLENSSIFSWPANRSDGLNPENLPNRIPEGTRFRLDPTVNVDALPITPTARIVAKAAQTYGFVVWDKAGSISLRFENPLAYTRRGKPDPYVTIFNGVQPYALLNGIPWNRLQFLPIDYGKPVNPH